MFPNRLLIFEAEEKNFLIHLFVTIEEKIGMAEQQYRIVLLPLGFVRAGFGLGLMGKLGHAWVGVWVVCW